MTVVSFAIIASFKGVLEWCTRRWRVEGDIYEKREDKGEGVFVEQHVYCCIKLYVLLWRQIEEGWKTKGGEVFVVLVAGYVCRILTTM